MRPNFLNILFSLLSVPTSKTRSSVGVLFMGVMGWGMVIGGVERMTHY